MPRLNRLRKNRAIRDLIKPTQLSVGNLVMPYFVVEGRNKSAPIASFPGINRLSVENLVKEVDGLRKLGIRAVLLFGVSGKKDDAGSFAYRNNGIVQKAIKAIKKKIKDTTVISDVCLCGVTTHGHCGIIKPVDGLSFLANGKQKKSGHQLSTINYKPEIDNDKTLKILAQIALSHAQAGADLVAPSAMADGQVKVIRETLDKNGFADIGILAYSAKFASNFYGPFREALGSSPKFGDRKGYQLDFRKADEALREIAQDINEGADIIMVKPALAYLDIIAKARERFNIPIAAYNVSGEYALVKAYTRDVETQKAITWEILTAIKRAGADLIITYHAKEIARWLK